MGRSFLTASATATVFVPGWRWMASMTAALVRLALVAQAATLSFWTLSMTRPRSFSRTGEPLR